MDPKCITAVTAAAKGRPVSAAKLQAIENAISKAMHELARRDRAKWVTLTRDQQMTQAAAAAMQDIQAQAALKEYRTNLQILKAVETEERVQRQLAISEGAPMGLTRSQAYIRDLVNTSDYADGIRNEAVAKLNDLVEAVGSKDGVGIGRNILMRVFDVDNPQMTADVVREVFGKADGRSNNKAATLAARAWLDTIEGMRQRFNSAGGDIGKLGYGYLSQLHDATKVSKAGAKAWAADVAPLMDRNQYVREDGSLMSLPEITQLLEAAQKTIATGGSNKTAPGQFKGTGARANRGSDSRVLHFRDGDAWMEYMGKYGEGSLYDSMIGHVSRMARDIALVERMGPNPETTHRLQSDIAKNADNPEGVGTAKTLVDTRSAGNTPDGYWRIVKGETGAPENRFLAKLGQDLRNVQTAAKITWGPFSALADVATIMVDLHYNKIPYFEYWKAVGRQMDDEHRALLRSHEVISDSLVSSLNRWIGDNMTHGWSGMMTNAVMKLSLMNAWTDGLRNAFADVMMHNHVKHLGKAWADISEWDRMLMERKGITEADWSVITKATPDPDSPVALLSGPRIRATGLAGAEEAATKWAAYVSDETQFAVVGPDLAARAIVTGGGMQSGTYSGEAWRAAMQFKSFPMSMLTRHWRRAMETPQGLEGAPLGYRGAGGASNAVNVIGTLAMLAVTTTIMGAIQTQARSLLTGKDPIDMFGEHAGKFWAKAFSAGGGAGFIADVLMAPGDDPSRQWQGHLGLAGPVLGAAGGLIDIAKDNHSGATAVRWASDQMPFVDMWQTRALYEHLFLHNAQELLNPGYLSRMQRRGMKQWGQDWYWQPGELAPDRAPDFPQAVGQ